MAAAGCGVDCTPYASGHHAFQYFNRFDESIINLVRYRYPENPFAPFQIARRCQRGPDRHHTKRGERRSAHSVKALGIAILRRVAAAIASVPGQLRPGDIRRSGGPMRSCRNRKHHFERPAARASRRGSDPFERARHAWERAAASGTAGASCAPGNPRRTFGGLTGPLTLLWLG
jgi:hypothetical protein